MIDLAAKCQQNGIYPKGVIHIGAHECQELPKYMSMGVQKIIFIEANPEIYNKIKHLHDENPNVVIVNCAICDSNGTADFHITSMDQSSSLLKLKKHLDYYPDITETKTITVITRTLDQLLIDINQKPEDYNILSIDTQGAELSVLSGAANTLKHIALINTEVNFEELYESGTMIDQLDSFLNNNFFTRIETVTPYHDSWGDAVYISNNLIQVSTLGINGRFANQIFQHMFASVYAFEYNLKAEFPTWIGQQIFNIQDNPITRKLELTDLENNLPELSLLNKDVMGWFQYHTSYYNPYRYLIYEKYSFKDSIKKSLDNIYNEQFTDKIVIAIHIRKSDYINNTNNKFFVAPLKWYCDWLESIWDNLINPMLYIASDDPEIDKQFEKYNPVTAKNIRLPIRITYLVDFYVMTKANFLAISNSSFSFLASMLNANLITPETNSCMRPSLANDKLISYNPWNAEVLLDEQPKDTFTPDKKPIRKLHIGGQQAHPDWEILNLENTPVTDHIGDAGSLYKFEENTFDEIYASHVLEHFDYLDITKVLTEWRRVLKPDGVLSVSVPDLGTISSILTKNLKLNQHDQFNLMRMIFGGHIDENDYHKIGFTRDILNMCLEAAGFKNIKKVKTFNSVFTDTSSMRYDNILISLNMTATK